MKKLSMNFLSKNILFFLIVILSFSCQNGLKTGDELSTAQISYIKSLGILEDDEKIIFFDSQGGYKMSGNFLSDKRLASYWIDNNHPEESSIEFAFYSEIDSIKVVDKTTAVTLSSYIIVFVNDTVDFKVYLDVDEISLSKFYEKTLELWDSNK
ncbi:MAG: hypothetical protein JXL97_16425 [Bacteroidales bacterium]|nr:hypothetical protein [Bacteroidales bacterium]